MRLKFVFPIGCRPPRCFHSAGLCERIISYAESATTCFNILERVRRRFLMTSAVTEHA
jgi:hypothetical protein